MDIFLSPTTDPVHTAKARNLAYFIDALNHGATLTARGRTVRESKCTVCYGRQFGADKFWFKNPVLYRGKPCGFESFYFHPCPVCMDEIKKAVPSFIVNHEGVTR